MKITEIQDGGTYMTKVGEERVKVRVAVQLAPRGNQMATYYRCTRLDTGKMLPKLRSPVAIHPCEATS